MKYKVVIGLEVHAELKTNTKIFCGCKNSFGAEVNTNCCPVCIGLPGALPVLNKKAVELCIKAGLAVGCTINEEAIFERKNYFYPDLPKAYQISQLEKPICLGGHIDIVKGSAPKTIRLNRIHLEEDAGKLIHDNGVTLIDYNRGGIPLIEIVSEPDISSSREAVEFLENLRKALTYAGVSECKMEQGSMRCDVNLSLMPEGSDKLGTRTEMKNLNSLSMVEAAIEYEIIRQTRVLDAGEKVIQETRRWNDASKKSIAMRSKENSDDYRYFPDPDLITISISRDYVKELQDSLPLSSIKRVEKYRDKLGLTEYDAQVLTSDVYYSDYYDECLKSYDKPKNLANIVMGELMQRLKLYETDKFAIMPEKLTTILKMQDSGEINQAGMRRLIDECWKSPNENPEKLADQLSLKQISDEGALKDIVLDLMKNNPNAIAELKNGNQKINSFFVGQAMKATGGKANAGIVLKIINENLAKF